MSFTPNTNFSGPEAQVIPSNVPHIWINGRVFDKDQATVSVFDRGFLYGDSVFETIRTYDKVPFALDEHLRRLFESADRVWIEPSVSQVQLKSAVQQALALFPLKEAYVRLMFTRGQAGLGLVPDQALRSNFVMILAPLNRPPATDYQKGIAAISLHQQRPQDGTSAAGAKIGNYLPAVLAYKEAEQKNAKEALFVSQSGEVAEGATSNLFWVKGDTIYTPPLAAGILDGITRRFVLKSAEALNISVTEKHTRLTDLKTADELFISSSIREIMPVTTLDEHPVADGKVGPITQALRKRFAQFTQSSE